MRVERSEVDDADRVVAFEVTGAFAGIEDQPGARALEPVVVRVAVQREVVFVAQHAVQVARVVHDDDAPAVPVKLERRFDELEAARFDRRHERFAFSIVVAEHTPQRCREVRERVNSLRLSDVAGVDDAIDASGVEELDDPRDVPQVVVRVADDADAHDARTEGGGVGNIGGGEPCRCNP